MLIAQIHSSGSLAQVHSSGKIPQGWFWADHSSGSITFTASGCNIITNVRKNL